MAKMPFSFNFLGVIKIMAYNILIINKIDLICF
jgi:hypothetical protein